MIKFGWTQGRLAQSILKIRARHAEDGSSHAAPSDFIDVEDSMLSMANRIEPVSAIKNEPLFQG
jgi:hypothetical protein